MTAESSPPARLGPVGPAEDSIEVRSRLGVYAVQGPILDFRASVSQKKFVYGVNVMIGMDDTGGELKHIEIPALRGCRVRRGAVPPYTAVRHLVGLTLCEYELN
jgi:hypothetical protein